MILRKAIQFDLPAIWEIIQFAIHQRKQDGSKQWQDGYPNESTIQNDIDNGNGYVLDDGEGALAYAAIIFDKEPAYKKIEGEWLSNGDYVVVHRVAVSERAKGKGMATELFKMIEDMSMNRSIFSIKVDTNFDNIPMLKILNRLGYTYCGEVYFRGGARKAFEKLLTQN